MEAVKQLLPILLTLSLAGLVLTVGLKSTKGDLMYVFSRPKLLAKAFVAVDVIPPLAAAILIWALPIDPIAKAGIMLMAISPVPPLVPGQELGVGARKEYAYGVYAAMALLTIIVVPVVFDIAARLFGHGRTLPFAVIFQTVFTGVLIPLGIGLLIGRSAPAFAQKAAPWVYRLSMLLVVLAFLPILVAVWPALAALVGNGTLVAMGAIVIVCLAAGHLLGGPEPIDRGTLAIAASVRHPGIAMLIANTAFDDKRVTAAVLLFMLVSLVLGTIYKTWFKRRMKAHASAAA